MLQGCQLPVAVPRGDQVELALMLGLCWIVAGAYNQLLIYRYVPDRDAGHDRVPAIINALVLICTIVLAWGKPGTVMFPRHAVPLVVLMLILSFILASLGNYFVARGRQMPDRLPLWIGPSTLAVVAVAVPLFFNSQNRWGVAACNNHGSPGPSSLFLATPPNRRSGGSQTECPLQYAGGSRTCGPVFQSALGSCQLLPTMG